jgi:FkbM family methyltransferase
MYAAPSLVWRKASYSQWGEDRLILDWFERHNGIHPSWIYADVGANHPTVINDTFLFYRAGYSGLLVEPNRELARICKLVRNRDTVLNIGAGNRTGTLRIFITTNPVFSSFERSQLEDTVAASYMVPVLRLDDLRGHIDGRRVFLLKIDTEGFDQNVLEGAPGLLANTMVVLTETRSDEERSQRAAILGPSWDIIYSSANTVFVNRAFFKSPK